MKMHRQKLLSILVSGSLLGLAACSGGSGGGGSDDDVSGLTMPDKLSVVTAKEEGAAKSATKALHLPYKTIAGAITSQTFDAASDYASDPSKTWVHDESMNALSTVNTILCLMEQTKSSDMVNQGAYVALINEDKCEEGKNDSQAASSGGQSSGNTVASLNRWVIESTRASDSAPQYVNIWVPGEPNVEHPLDGQDMLVGVTITESASDAHPFGAFSLSFEGVVDAEVLGGTPGTSVTTMKGTLIGETTDLGKPHFRFINGGGQMINPAITEFSMEEAADVVLDDATGTSGVAKTKESYHEVKEGGEHTSNSVFAVAFDENYFLRGQLDADNVPTGDNSCLNRNEFDTHIWRYNLYFRDNGTFEDLPVTAGQRVKRNSSFPFTYDNNGTKVNGNVGYWGIWMEDESLVSTLNGKTITRFDYNSNATSTYTVSVSSGKAIKREAHVKALADFEGGEFYSWMQHSTEGFPGDGNTFNTWLVSVQGGEFTITHGITWGDNGPVKTDVTDDPVTFTFDGENLWLWSDGLNGNVVYVHNADPSLQKVTFYAQETVYPNTAGVFSGPGSVDLSCWDRCPKGGMPANPSSESDLFYTPNWNTDTPRWYDYRLTLGTDGSIALYDMYTGSPVAVTVDGVNLTGIPGYEWGNLQSGEMVTADIRAALAGKEWEIYQAARSFHWETGTQSWNRLVTVVDANGQAAKFDKPLQFAYTVDGATDVRNTAEAAYDGQTFMLNYGGAGDLWGFPWSADPNCTDTEDKCRWYPGVTLMDGVELAMDDTTFVVKGIEGEQSMSEVGDTAVCTNAHAGNEVGLNLDGAAALTLPTIADIDAVTHTWDERPDIEDAPAVIEGEIQ